MKTKELSTKPIIATDERPPAEKQLDWLLSNWRRWNLFGSNEGPALELMGTGGEMIPDETEERRAPRAVPPDPHAAWKVERCIARLREQHRKALRTYWVYMKRGRQELEDTFRERVRRKLGQPRWMFEQDLLEARAALRDMLRRLYGLPL